MTNIDQLERITITAVGDGNVGKTSMLTRYIRDEIPPDYIPTVFDNHVGKMLIDGNLYTIQLWDTAGQEDYDRLRALSYTATDCFLVCFALNSESAYINVQEKWIPEIRHLKKEAPVILVGTKSDLRTDSDEFILSTAECDKLRDVVRATKYIECSAFTREGIDDVFEEAVRAVIYKETKKKKRFRCTVF